MLFEQLGWEAAAEYWYIPLQLFHDGSQFTCVGHILEER